MGVVQILGLVCAILIGILGILAIASLLIYYMHMFQLNSYKADEQGRFMRDNTGQLLGRSMGFILSLILCIIGIFAAAPVMLGITALMYYLTAWGNRPWARIAKRPLVVTGRVRRMFVTTGVLVAIILTAVTVTAALFIGIELRTAVIVCISISLLGILSPYLLFAANVINHPREEAINNHFIKEAKDMVASMPNLKVVGITGSFGKTSTKYFLTKLLEGKYNVLMTPGNFNTVLGVTKTVREQLAATHEIFVCEMGARRVKEIKGVCDIVNPDMGIITSIGAQHLETFGSMENIINTKLELSDALPKDGRLYINADNEILKNRSYDKPVTSYGVENPQADYVPKNIHATEKGSEFDITFPNGELVHFTTPLLGTHNVLNLAGCIAVAYDLKVPAGVMVRQAAKLQAPPHRLQLVNSGRGIVIDDAYNSNPAGARAAMECMKQFDGIHIIVTPGMVELGEKQYELNKELGRQAAMLCDYIVLVGVKQTEPIQDGVREGGFDEKKLFVVSDLQEGLSKVDAIDAGDKKKIILLENDLPDNY